MTILRVATFNINGIRSRLAGLLEWLEREAPDVVCLQELKAPNAAFPIAEIREAGYGAIWQGQTSWNPMSAYTPSGIIFASTGEPTLGFGSTTCC
jgi:exodeoxyribonuclease III